MYRLLFLLFLGASLTACVSKQLARGGKLTNENAANSIGADQVGDVVLNLTDYLSRVSGVHVSGNGSAARVRVRGPQSFYAGQGPLYVVNGSIIGHDYTTIYNAINVREIARVRVLKNASETAMYGTRGATGVVEITLRET